MQRSCTPMCVLFVATSLANMWIVPDLVAASATDPSVTALYFSARDGIAPTAKNTSTEILNAEGSNLGNVSVFKLVSASGEEYALDLTTMTATAVHGRMRAISASRPPVPPGVYRVRVGTPTSSIISTQTVTLTGVTVTSFSPTAAVHTTLLIHLNGTDLPDVAVVKLRDAKGNDWPSSSIRQIPSGASVSWNTAVPAGEYTIVVFNSAGVELAKAPGKFRAFANPQQ